MLAAIGHYNLLTIYPFPAGNGRVARLLMNIVLLHNSFTPAIIEPEQKTEYCKAIEETRASDNLLFFTEFIAQCVVDSQEPLIQLASLARKKDYVS